MTFAANLVEYLMVKSAAEFLGVSPSTPSQPGQGRETEPRTCVAGGRREGVIDMTARGRMRSSERYGVLV